MFSPEKFCSNKLAGSSDASARSSSAAATVNHAIGHVRSIRRRNRESVIVGGSAVHFWQDEEISKLRRSDDVVEVRKYVLLSS
jgi:3-oxoacyl-(acyl-carrier-protein) synthase